MIQAPEPPRVRPCLRAMAGLNETPLGEASRILARPPKKALAALWEAADACTRCPIYQNATQGVAGEGPVPAAMMIVGEQPGDQEDLAGRPFVGPAGKALDKALKEAGVAREQVFVTNAVKHFKNELRNKRRQHRRPTVKEIDICRKWLEIEIDIVQPDLIVALGVSAVRGVTGKTGTISKLRGAPVPLEGGRRMLVTVHPASLLRIPDRESRSRERARFVEDLKLAASLVA